MAPHLMRAQGVYKANKHATPTHTPQKHKHSNHGFNGNRRKKARNQQAEKKRWVFSFDLKEESDVACLRLGGALYGLYERVQTMLNRSELRTGLQWRVSFRHALTIDFCHEIRCGCFDERGCICDVGTSLIEIKSFIAETRTVPAKSHKNSQTKVTEYQQFKYVLI